MTEDLDQLRGLARTFFEKEAVPHQERWAAQKQVDRGFWHKAGELGLAGALATATRQAVS